MRIATQEKEFANQQTLFNFFAKEIETVNKIIDEELGSNVDVVNLMGHYIYDSGGKRLRPLMTIASAALFGPVTKDVMYLAAAVELIHTATLLHDDVIDNATKRRGNDTANIKWGNAVSVLVGDYIFSKAFQLMVKANCLDVLQLLSQTSSRIAEGEVWQMVTVNTLNLNRANYLEIIRAKTASLFGAACKVGGMLYNRSQQELNYLWSMGESVGMAFQIIDDALDYDINRSNTGKECGNDFFEGKLTLPIINVIEKGKELEFWRDAFCNNNRSQQDLLKAVDILEKENALEESRNLAREQIDLGLLMLSHLPQGEINYLLYDCIIQSIERKI
jgi:octaprenyl-diphosphate synthase